MGRYQTMYAAKILRKQEIGSFMLKLVRRAYDDESIGNEYDVIVYDRWHIWHHVVVIGTTGEAINKWEEERQHVAVEIARRALGLAA